MTPSLAQSPALSVLISLLWMTLGCFRYHRMPPKVSIAWSTRHMSAARWLLAPICIRRASTRSCRKCWRRPLLTDCRTMLTSLSPGGIASAWDLVEPGGHVLGAMSAQVTTVDVHGRGRIARQRVDGVANQVVAFLALVSRQAVGHGECIGFEDDRRPRTAHVG